MLDAKGIAGWPGKVIDGEFQPALWHMLDVGAVADRLVRKRPVTGSFALDQAIVYLVALHDLGKFSESFRDQVAGAAARTECHAQLGFVLLRYLDSLLAERIGGTPDARRVLCAAVAGHHGGPPEPDDGSGIPGRRWMAAIGAQGIEAAADAVETVGTLFPEASLEGLSNGDANALSWKVSGLTVLADWIGSSTEWFGRRPAGVPVATYWARARRRARDAVTKAGLHRAKPRADAAILPWRTPPRPMQQAVRRIELPEGPALAMIEDAAGSGKTEAGLMLASRMMAAGKGDGLFIALPEMATSNAMLARIGKIAASLFAGRPSLGLSHGRVRRSARFRRILGSDGSDPDEPVTCGQWLADDRRRILLADIGVGTVDQALLAVRPRRFSALRLWALSSKILIVDEAHGHDPFMEEALRSLLGFHAMMGGSAIVMSATLPKRMRDGHAEAFQRGLGMLRPSGIEGNAYPQLSVVSKRAETLAPAPVPATCRNVAVRRVDAEAAMERLREGAERGAACVWIRNAADDAVAALEALESRGVPADLLHARFTVADRLRREDALQARFGRDGKRRRGGVLIATQVVEAAPDLDFDVMVSDLAPIGALIQRAGRLWRHMDLRPAESRPAPGPELHVLSPDPETVEDARWLHGVLDAGAGVYPLSDQWRTARAVFGAGAIRTPDGLRDLIEAVHGPDAEAVPDALGCALEGGPGKETGGRRMENDLLLSTRLDGRPPDYLSAAQGVRDEERLVTRLGVPQVTLRLARAVQGGLEPFADSWEGSEVQMSRERCERLGGVDQETPEVAALKASWPDWARSAIQVAVVGEDGRISNGLRYDSRLGLLAAPAVGDH